MAQGCNSTDSSGDVSWSSCHEEEECFFPYYWHEWDALRTGGSSEAILGWLWGRLVLREQPMRNEVMWVGLP